MEANKQEPVPLEGWKPDPNKMPAADAGDIGAVVFQKIKEIYQVVDWADDDEICPDPYIQIVIHKSGQILVKNYIDDKPTEFQMDDLTNAD